MKMACGAVTIIAFCSISFGQVWIDNSEVLGAVALGRGGTAIAVAGEAAGAWANPAGLAQIDKPQVQADLESYTIQYQALARAYQSLGPETYQMDARDSDKTHGEDNQFDHIAVAQPLRLAGRPAAILIGYRRLAVFPDLARRWTVRSNYYSPDSPAQSWEEDYFSSTENEGGMNDWGLAFAMEILPRLRGGIIVHYLKSDLRTAFNQYQLQEDDEVLISQGAFQHSFSGWRWDGGLQFDVGRGFTLGAIYRSVLDAGMEYRQGQTLPLESASSGSTTVHWPVGWAFGVGWRPVQAVLLACDYSRMAWSEAVVGEILLSGEPPSENLDYPSFWPNQMNTITWRLGAERRFGNNENFNWTLRAGYYRQEQMTNHAALPYLSADYGDQPVHDGLTFGLGIHMPHWRINAAYVWGSWSERASTDSYFTPPRGRRLTPPAIGIWEQTVDISIHRFLLSATFMLN